MSSDLAKSKTNLALIIQDICNSLLRQCEAVQSDAEFAELSERISRHESVLTRGS